MFERIATKNEIYTDADAIAKISSIQEYWVYKKLDPQKNEVVPPFWTGLRLC